MSVSDWITEKIRGGNKLSDDTLSVIADFTLMWALFEGTEAHGQGLVVVDQLKDIAARVTCSFPQALLTEFIEYWAQRYIEGGNTNHRFELLNFTHEPHKNQL